MNVANDSLKTTFLFFAWNGVTYIKIGIPVHAGLPGDGMGWFHWFDPSHGVNGNPPRQASVAFGPLRRSLAD